MKQGVFAFAFALLAAVGCGSKKAAAPPAEAVPAPIEAANPDDLLTLREPLEKAARAWVANDLAAAAPLLLAEGSPYMRSALLPGEAEGVKLLTIDAAVYVVPADATRARAVFVSFHIGAHATVIDLRASEPRAEDVAQADDKDAFTGLAAGFRSTARALVLSAVDQKCPQPPWSGDDVLAALPSAIQEELVGALASSKHGAAKVCEDIAAAGAGAVIKVRPGRARFALSDKAGDVKSVLTIDIDAMRTAGMVLHLTPVEVRPAPPPALAPR